MHRTVAPVLALLSLTIASSAQIAYHVRPDFEAGEWQVEVHFPARGEQPIDFHFPRWTPGAYHFADYGRFVEELSALGSEGTALEVERVEESQFELSGTAAAGEVVVRYRARSASGQVLDADLIDVEANRIRADYAYINPCSLLGFVEGRLDEPATVTFEFPEGWEIDTALERDAEGRYLAPSYYRLEDSPFLFSRDLQRVEFEVEGKPHVVAVHGKDAQEARALAEVCERIVRAGAALMQGLPYERYHFLLGFAPEAQGSGLEHTESTLILLGERETAESDGTRHVIAHEFMHLWCAERIHVQGIRHPDFTRPFQTGTIWVNEGITEYMSRHILLHAGYLEPEKLLADLVPMKPYGVPQGLSWTQVSRDMGADDKPLMLVAIPFMLRMYEQGPRTILALDLAMRRASGGERGILDFLHFLMWAYDAAGRGFGEDELPALLSGVAQADMYDFYRRYIDGPELPVPADDLELLGYRWDGKQIVALDEVGPEQLRARSDFFSASGRP